MEGMTLADDLEWSPGLKMQGRWQGCLTAACNVGNIPKRESFNLMTFKHRDALYESCPALAIE